MSIVLYDVLYLGPNSVPVKVIDKTLFRVTVSGLDCAYDVNMIEFLTMYQKIS